MMASTTRNKLITALSILFLIGVWKIASGLIASDLVLPSPEHTLASTWHLLISPDFLLIVGATISRGVLGFILSFILGLAIGILAGMSSGFNAFFKPILVTIRSIPIIALILLALIWLQVDMVPVFIAFLTMFPFICTNVIEGIKNVDPDLVEMAQTYRISRSRIVKEVYIPAITPYIFSGASSAMGIGWRAIIIGEVLSLPQMGIGTFMQNAQTYLKVDVVIAWTIVAVVISYLFEVIIRRVERAIVVWKKP